MIDLRGIPIVVQDPLYGAEVLEVRQNRRHRRSKVNRKWHRRYGTTTIYAPMGYLFEGQYIMNSPMLALLKKRLEAQ